MDLKVAYFQTNQYFLDKFHTMKTTFESYVCGWARAQPWFQRGPKWQVYSNRTYIKPYIYIYIHMSLYVFICIYMYWYVLICIDIFFMCIYMFSFVFKCIFMYSYVIMYLYVFMCIYMYLSVFLRIYMYLYVFICIYMYLCIIYMYFYANYSQNGFLSSLTGNKWVQMK